MCRAARADGGVRVRLGEQDGGGPVAASEVGDGPATLQLFVDSVERRYPLRDEVGDVTRLEQSLRPVEQVVLVLVHASPLPDVNASRILS